MVETMNSGIRVRESIRASCAAFRYVRTFNRRTVDGPRPWKAEEESSKHREMGRVANAPAGLPMKQIPNAFLHWRLPGTRFEQRHSTNAHDRDGTFNKEFRR
jgi:hypothetical protein